MASPSFEYSALGSSQRTFPTSSARDEPPADPSAPVYDPLRVLSLPPNPYPSENTDILLKSKPVEISPGVMSDGRLTIDHPLVQEHLAKPVPLSHASTSSQYGKAVWSLSALAVALDPDHPAYNHFWNKDACRTTSLFVAGQADYMYHPGLYIYGYYELLIEVLRAHRRWLGPVEEEPENVKNRLRKRKEVEVVDSDVEERTSPPPKRIRTRSAQTPKRTNPNAPYKPSPLALSVVLPPAEDSPPIKVAPAPTRTSQRPKKKSTHAREAEEHAAAAEEAPMLTVPARPSVRRAASSGASSAASTSTAVEVEQIVPTRSRSGSASSAVTAVDVTAALQKESIKGKEKASSVPRSTRGQTRASTTPAPAEVADVASAPEVDMAAAPAGPEAQPTAPRAKRARQPRAAAAARQPRRK
ncbi:hypothetical protein K488DRAFT_89575 [Vararia minispora EC-137]|uniref:Uncharacterized protein n=1 Tax=Vararia minispora EC-137 TaxID=1314806 RepID=A0ACB8QA35_9AGAM|nr:hypothetical protein K488DRAFT_89575 [Vararia minispora EC-137]